MNSLTIAIASVSTRTRSGRPPAAALGCSTRGLLVIVGAEESFCTEIARLCRRDYSAGRPLVDVDVDPPVDPHGVLLRIGPSRFDESRCAFTLALNEVRELGLRHVHRLAPVLGNPVVQFMPGQRACDIPRELVDDSGRSARRHP